MVVPVVVIFVHSVHWASKKSGWCKFECIRGNARQTNQTKMRIMLMASNARVSGDKTPSCIAWLWPVGTTVGSSKASECIQNLVTCRQRLFTAKGIMQQRAIYKWPPKCCVMHICSFDRQRPFQRAPLHDL